MCNIRLQRLFVFACTLIIVYIYLFQFMIDFISLVVLEVIAAVDVVDVFVYFIAVALL